MTGLLVPSGNTTLAARLIEAREAAGLTQEELASRARVSQGTIGNVEAGIRKKPRELLAIATALGVAPRWLETGEGSMKNGAPPPMEWPFELLSREQWGALTERQRGAVESAALQMFNELIKPTGTRPVRTKPT